MSTYSNLNEAWSAQIRTLNIPDECSICFEPFTDGHSPVACVGSNACTHIFGSECLKTWCRESLIDAVKCPMCRQLWFHVAEHNSTVENESGAFAEEESNDEPSVSGEMSEDLDIELRDDEDDDSFEPDTYETNDITALEHIRSRETAAVTVYMLFHKLLNCELDAGDEELKACVEQALEDADLHGSIPITDDLWDRIGGMAKRMRRDARTTDWDDHTERNWVRRLVRALGLRLES